MLKKQILRNKAEKHQKFKHTTAEIKSSIEKLKDKVKEISQKERISKARKQKIIQSIQEVQHPTKNRKKREENHRRKKCKKT